MDFKKIITEILDNLKKNEITISTKFNNNSEIVDKSKIGGKPYLPKDWATYIYDGSLLIGNMMLAAHSLNIGSCWIHRAKQEFESEEGKEILKSLGINGDYEGIGHCVLGYIDDNYPNIPARKENRVYYID